MSRHRALGSQPIDDVGIEQVAIVPADDQDPPRELARPAGACDPRLAREHALGAVPHHLGIRRIRRKQPGEPAGGARQAHAGIVEEIRFGYRQRRAPRAPGG